jgi:hypothetical protein
MKTQSARDLAIELFSGVPGLKRVEANTEDDLWERVGVILFFVIAADSYAEVRDKIISAFVQFLVDSGLAADFRIVREGDYSGEKNVLIYTSEDSAA